jgi:plastocyanin
MKNEKTIAIDIDLTRGLVGLLALALLVAAFGGYLAWGQGEVAASGPQAPLDHARDKPLASSAGMRQYYLTQTFHRGAEADGAGVGADGYHFASLWEIMDPSSLKYDTTLGKTSDDSDQGPPTYQSVGWVRTANDKVGNYGVTVLTNTVHISSDNDSDLNNNGQVVEVLIDPEGVVFDVTQGQDTLLQGAAVTCYEGQIDPLSGEKTYGLWDAESYGGQVNPQTTASDGYFSFFTPAGFYQLDVYKDGYQPYRSWDLVVDEPIEFNVPLTPEIAEEADWTITVSEAGFDQPMLTVQPGDIIQWINVGDELHTSTSISPAAHMEGLGLLTPTYTDAWDSGLLSSGESYKRQLNTSGSYYYYDHESIGHPNFGLIVVQGTTIYLPIVIKNN